MRCLALAWLAFSAAACSRTRDIPVAALIGSKADPTNDLRVVQQLVAGTAAGAAAGSLTLLITFPLTKDLGTEL